MEEKENNDERKWGKYKGKKEKKKDKKIILGRTREDEVDVDND